MALVTLRDGVGKDEWSFMSNTLVVYQSAYGHTKTYADWIAQELGCPTLPAAEATLGRLYEPEVIIFGCGIYAEKFEGAAPLLRQFPALSQKTLILFGVGLLSGPEGDESYFHQLVQKNFPAEVRARVRFYHFPGGIQYDALKLSHRAMLSLFCRMLRTKKDLAEDERRILDCYGKNADFSDRSAIRPLVDYARRFGGDA